MNAIESLSYFGSELVIVIAFFAALKLDFFISDKKWIGYLCLLALVLAWFAGPSVKQPLDLFFGYFRLDGFTHFFKLAIYIAIGLTILASLAYEGLPKKVRGEFYVLMLALALLLTLMAAATNLLMVFLAIESVSLTSYLLVGFQKFDKQASEASLKYVLFGAVSTALMLFGMSFVFGATGTIDLAGIGGVIAQAGTEIRAMSLIGMFFILAGIGFKISMAPFHMWAPDVYQGAPTPVTAFLTVAPKALGFAVLARVLFLAFPGLVANWTHLLAVLAVLTMTLGNVLAISQSDIKRLLAYSSIAQAGYILVGIAVATPLGLEAILVYVIAYIFTNLGAFFTVIAIERSAGTNNISAYHGLSNRNPFLALALLVFLLSLAGIPPLAGFVGKVYIFAAAVEANAVGLAVAIAINSAIAAFYYFKVVKAMYLVPAESNEPVHNPIPIRLAVGAALVGILVIGLYPPSLIRLAEQSLAAFPVF
jgi:NADH-quinone oxidoreductase subunit N